MPRTLHSWSRFAIVPTACLGITGSALGFQGDVAGVERAVNQNIVSIKKTSFETLFDAALDLSAAPSESGGADDGFNLRTIHGSMATWQDVSDWAESNPQMADAVLACRDMILIGLPYGKDNVSQATTPEQARRYVEAGMYADIAVDGSLRTQDFAYLRWIDTIAAFTTAECYRLLGSGSPTDVQRAVDLMTAQIYVNDQLCERLFLIEKLHAVRLQVDFLECVRDMIYAHLDSFTIDQLAAPEYGPEDSDYKGLSFELPWLRIDMLEMPTGDYTAADAMIEGVFDGSEADPALFSTTFGEIQAQDAPFTQFGAAKRWRMVAAFHGSKIDTDERLELVYDDWWRRWGIRAWHQILDLEPQYNRTNPVRFAAVTYAMRDIGDIFVARRQLIAAANGTALAAALAAYRKQFGTYPDDLEKVYATFIRKRSDLDPFDKEVGGFGYRFVTASSAANLMTEDYGFISIREGLLWARGQDFESNRGTSHSFDGLTDGTDIVFWPAVRAVARQQGVGD